MRFKTNRKAMKKMVQIFLIVKFQYLVAMAEAVVVIVVKAAAIDRVISITEIMNDQIIKIRKPMEKND